MVVRTSSRQKPAHVPSSSQPTSSRLYYGCVVGLCMFLALCFFWPKQPSVEKVHSTIEVVLTQDQIDGGWFSDLLQEAWAESLAQESLANLVSLAAAAHSRTQSQLQKDPEFPVNEETMKNWLRTQVNCQEIGDATDEYRLIELTGRGMQGDLAAHLINQLATQLAEKLNHKLTAEQLMAQWAVHQSKIEDDLRYRRQWVDDLSLAIRQQSHALQQLASFQSTTQSSAPTRLASTELQTPAELQSPASESQQELELLLAEIEMQQGQLLELAKRHRWSGAHPEFQGRLSQIEQLQVKAEQLAEATAVPHLSKHQHQARIEENGYFRQKAESEAVQNQLEIQGLVQDSMTHHQEVINLEHEAAQWLDEDENRVSEVRNWINQLSIEPHHQPLRIVEFARQPELPKQTIPATHWLMMGLISAGVSVGLTLAINRRPSQFRSSRDVAKQLGIELLGVIPVKPSGRRDWLTWLKRHEENIRVACEITILLMVGFTIVGLFREPRLMTLLLQNPFEGIAQSMETFRHP